MDRNVIDASEWFAPFDEEISTYWTYDRAFYVFTELDNYDFGDADLSPLKQKIKEHKNKILAETITVPAFKRYRKKFKIPKSHFWWWIDKL